VDDRTNGNGSSEAWENEVIQLRCLKCGKHLGAGSVETMGVVKINCKKYECKVINIFTLQFKEGSLQIVNAKTERKPIIIRT